MYNLTHLHVLSDYTVFKNMYTGRESYSIYF